MKSVRSAGLKGKVVLLRADFNVPLKDGCVEDDSRIRDSLPTIKYILKKASKIVILSHLGRPDGKVVGSLRLDAVAGKLSSLLKVKVLKLDDCIGQRKFIDRAKERVVLLENLRFHSEEEKNDLKFAKALAAEGDVFVNDAFSVCHRAHASVCAITTFLPSFAGFGLLDEVKALSKIRDHPKRPFIIVVGGAKISTKIGVIRNLNADVVLVGGALALTFVKALGFEVGTSVVEDDKLVEAKGILSACKKKIMLPIDFVCGKQDGSVARVYDAEHMLKNLAALDIGPETAEVYAAIIRKAKTVFWNGPMGLFEVKPFDAGTRIVAKAIAKKSGVVGGGDTVFAVNKLKVRGFSHISTGGGASLEFLEGKTLPGIGALEKNV